MSLEKLIGEECIKQLNAQEFYCIETTEECIVFEHSINRCKMIIKDICGDIFLNFKNVEGEIFLKLNWYLGNEYGLCREDIFTIISKPEFKIFCECKQEFIDEKTEEYKNLKSILLSYDKDFFDVLNSLDFGFAGENLDRLIFIHRKSNTELVIRQYDRCIFYNFIRNEKDMFYNDGFGKLLGLTEKIEIEELYKLIKTRDFEIFLYKDTEDYNKQDEKLSKDFMINITDTQNKIKNLCDKISEILIYKNQKYGNSALEPNNIFYKGNAETNILIRLDDKIGRIKNNNDEIRINDIVDMIGYLILLLINKNVGYCDLEELKD